MSMHPAPGKWSKKEILGHLIDSACNNHSRFVRAQFEEPPFKVVQYKQEEWVVHQRYNDMPVEQLLILWSYYNKHIAKVISYINKNKLDTPVILPSGERVTFYWLIEDYLNHLEHHLKQLLG